MEVECTKILVLFSRLMFKKPDNNAPLSSVLLSLCLCLCKDSSFIRSSLLLLTKRTFIWKRIVITIKKLSNDIHSCFLIIFILQGKHNCSSSFHVMFVIKYCQVMIMLGYESHTTYTTPPVQLTVQSSFTRLFYLYFPYFNDEEN